MVPPHPSNQPPNDGPFNQPMSRLDELLADRAVQGLDDGEEIELRRLLTAAGKAEDSSLDLAAAACDSAFHPAHDQIAMPASLLAALDREGEAWCNGVSSGAARVVYPYTGQLTDVGQGRLLRTPFKRFTREYGGWLAAAACLTFGLYAWNSREGTVVQNIVVGPPKPIEAGFMSRPLELAAERWDRWFREGKESKLIPLGSATPDAGPDVAVGEVAWNPEDGNGLLYLKSPEDLKSDVSRSYRVSVRCAKTGKQTTIETGAVTFKPGQKEVVVPISPNEMLHGAAAFVVSVCTPGQFGVSQSEGVVGIGGALGESGATPEAQGN